MFRCGNRRAAKMCTSGLHQGKFQYSRPVCFSLLKQGQKCKPGGEMHPNVVLCMSYILLSLLGWLLMQHVANDLADKSSKF